MFEIYNKVDGTYTLPDGSVMTSKEMEESGEYQMLFSATCVVSILDGILVSYQPLEQLAEGYGVEYEPGVTDPKKTLDTILERKKLLQDNPPVTLNDTVLKAAQFAALSFTDEQALEVPDLYPEYEVNHEYKQNERFTYKGRLFKVNQDHTSSEQWIPGETGTESLYTCLEMAGDGYLVWTRPTGAHNAYNAGDIVHFPTDADPLYKSLIDGNTWSPTEYPQGWELYTEE